MLGYTELKNDVKAIKNFVMHINKSINELHCKMFQRHPSCTCNTGTCIKECGVITEENEGQSNKFEHIEYLLEQIKESVDDNDRQIERIHDKLNVLVEDDKRLEFDDYMKNVDKLNLMVNEIKGIASMVRATLQETKPVKKTRKPKSET